MRKHSSSYPGRWWLPLAIAGILAAMSGCSATPQPGVKRLAEGMEHSGFLKTYANLKPNPEIEGQAITYVNPDAASNLRRYVAIIVDPVDLYISSKADETNIPDRARETVTNYFRHALENAVTDAFPIVDSPGPLVLRLRAAIVGIDTGGEVAPVSEAALTAEPLPRALVLENVAVEMELVDSVTGEQVAAMVDKMKLGEGAEVGTENFSRLERFNEAKRAFDEWAFRVRAFLDAEHELSAEDAKRADETYRPYGR